MMMNEFELQPHNEVGPVFSEPWEAQAFALVLALQQQGAFSWKEWAQVLNARIVAAQALGDPDLGDTYYHHWLAALEQMTLKKGLTDREEIGSRLAAWRDAYLSTPHGEPVELKA
ncbi:MAG: nitrile hydratase accessory protein [Gammaproteobacteria bacterium]|nr:nitrile hydratase accessory protein [Gammaproteobacteria bacterium]MCY4356657.1 nitrile hydratase accessory protein [Gammaproteobacteria bacterium]